MQREEPDVVLHGALGGIIAGLVVVTWFVVVDLAAGQPFETPARLAGVVLGEEFSGPWPRLIAMYTILHFGIFATLGVVAAWFLRSIEVDPGLILGAVFGVGVLNAVHYAGLLITGTNLLTVVPVGHVTAANLLGGMIMMAYLHRAFRAESPLGWSVLKRYPLLYDGLITGVVGAATVAFWFFVVDLLTSTPFYTPAALGSALLLGAVGTSAEIQVNFGVVVAYSFLHVTVFGLIGVTFAWLADRVEHAPGFLMRSATVLIAVEVLFLGTVSISSGWLLDSLGWATILVGNALAVVTMSAWIWRKRPKLREQLIGQVVANRA